LGGVGGGGGGDMGLQTKLHLLNLWKSYNYALLNNEKKQTRICGDKWAAGCGQVFFFCRPRLLCFSQLVRRDMHVSYHSNSLTFSRNSIDLLYYFTCFTVQKRE
jgi:hypothetical protein